MPARERHRLLIEASASLAASLDYQTTLETIAQLSVPRLADWCVVDVFEDDGSLHRLAVAHPDPAKVELARALSRRYTYDPNGLHPIMKALRTGLSQMASRVSDELLSAAYPDHEQFEIVRELGFKSFIIVPLLAHGKVLGVISFVTSESGRRYNRDDMALAEELVSRAALAVDNARLYRQSQEAHRVKDEFLATVSHELRTPLTAILGWAHMLRSGNLNESSRALAIETIERNARSQAQLIDDLLDVSRIITGKLQLDLQQIDLAPIIKAAVDAVQPVADARDVRLRTHLGAGVGIVSVDPHRIQQVVWNLLSNALKFTPKGGVVEIRLERAGSNAQIVVEDTGQGISAEFLPFVFDRFRQGDATTTRKHGGLGLGLSIVHSLITMHGGTIRAESPGEALGSVFTVRLPLVAIKAESHEIEQMLAPGEQAPWSLPAASLAGLRVLAVDDDVDARRLIRVVLEQCGAEVATASSAAEALDAIVAFRPDVLVSDIGMPDEDGYSLINKVRLLPPEKGGDTPAVALTAYARSDDRAHSLQLGFQIHVAKPIEPDRLVFTVAQAAGRVVDMMPAAETVLTE